MRATFRLFLEANIEGKFVRAGTTGKARQILKQCSKVLKDWCVAPGGCPTMLLLECRRRMALPYKSVLCPEPIPVL